MSDLRCRACGAEGSYADSAIADSLRTCPGEQDADLPRVTQHTAVGAVRAGQKHDWVEVQG